jgi:asparagine synthase (glutamine-hydrolysing)
MCGICGIVSDSGPPDLVLLSRMMGRLGHRGPDGNGWYRDRRTALGHTRLAIIDTSGGAQPLCNEDGTVWVTYNGEIFNYVELAEELRHLGHTFRTASDTEVIVHAWEEWGEECFPRFNGQWALALWDRRAQRLVLSRDRLGVRPLFFARRPGGLLFASEVKSIFADLSVERTFDPAGLDQTFTYWSPVAPRTVFRGIEQLEPGHYAILDSGGFRKAPYWHATFPPRGHELGQDAQENAEALRERIIEAARLRFLRSDVPVGAYLSGVLGTQHQDIMVSPSDIAAVFPEVIRHAETPVLRAAPAPLFLLSKLVRENGCKVVVTGEGADEVLAGYDLFREARVRLFWSRDPGSAKRTRAAELLYPWMARSPGRIPAFARSFFGRHLDPGDPALSHRPRWDSTSVIKNMLSADLQDRIGRAGAEDVVAAMPPGSADWDPLSRGQWLEMTTLLTGYILAAQGDRMLMANSVEGRFPFLDADVVDFANTLPARHKLFGLEEKYLLKRAFADLVPDDIIHRPKQPYRAPDAASFFAAGRPAWFDEVMSERAVAAAGVFEPSVVAGLLAKCQRTGGENMSNTDNMRVLAIVSTQLTHESFIAGGGLGALDRPLPEPSVAVDLVTDYRSVP